MPSPFPGMDPYLEGEMWQEFHERLAHQLSAQLMPYLRPNYVALLAKRYVVDRPALSILDVEAPRVIYPDVHIVAPPGSAVAPHLHEVGGAIAEPAVEVLGLVATPQLTIEVRDVAQRLLVTMIEILSPINKRGEGWRDYDLRRTEILTHTKTHLLEIDLLRQGLRIALGEIPAATYYIYLSRVQRRPFTQVWPIALHAPLPTVPVPLLEPDPDVPLNMQAAVQACFDLVGYERLLDYTAPPPPPAMVSEAAAWVEAVLHAAGYR